MVNRNFEMHAWSPNLRRIKLLIFLLIIIFQQLFVYIFVYRSFDILHATFLEFSGLAHSPSWVTTNESTAYAIVNNEVNTSTL